MADAKQVAKLAYSLIDFFIVQYNSRFKRDPQINRYRVKYGFQDMINDLGFEQSKRVIEFYISGNRNSYTVNDLLYSYDKINRVIEEQDADEENRRILKEETKRRVEEWKSTHGQC